MKLRSVTVKAINLKPGDVLSGGRIRQVLTFGRRNGDGVLVVTPHPDGYDVRTFKFKGHDRVSVKRPAYNMG